MLFQHHLPFAKRLPRSIRAENLDIVQYCSIWYIRDRLVTTYLVVQELKSDLLRTHRARNLRGLQRRGLTNLGTLGMQINSRPCHYWYTPEANLQMQWKGYRPKSRLTQAIKQLRVIFSMEPTFHNKKINFTQVVVTAVDESDCPSKDIGILIISSNISQY